MHILPLILLSLLLSCSANKERKKDPPSQTYNPTFPSPPSPLRPGSTPTPDKSKDDSDRLDTGKETAQDKETGKETTQDEETGKEDEETGKEDPLPVQEEEPLRVTLSFAADFKGVLYPLLEFSPQYVTEVQDVSLKSTAATLLLNQDALKLKPQGIKLHALVFRLQLTWRDKTCHERIEVEDMTKTTEVVCQ